MASELTAGPVPPAKSCTTCKQVMSLSDFYCTRANPDGLDYRCKVCAKANLANRNRAVAALIAAHRTEFDHLVLLARRGEL